ncbi:bifunctional hydroxymethylpyrimidine kinase/phosphomethylpyrimidine kinase [Planosporangium mesophilum]|uniref:Hydroxymethylpyrimidine/phosphomethylpyrimidine kinase n=1 Tax=Planosporangium mesophilum TaxID=689768 RepID=A0A8J3TGC6_9ACTN|nr:bifunctional hydroxymethylpyrimidine kinase/phosphomethylpyrimidine kinase [Planosporangium mesophilum]NJC84758.1 bifunctional hydroxymethylpyrimidine kinase/phosphomethylpyrimidine kinase [Planosporangium mesophilum]GII24224.1 hydroxymethylpyrimidine/phosphomethylpyrimidine kinase [Planosporangium mesophilum]
MTPPVVLAVGGSDSLGGDGIQGDLRTLSALRVYGTSVVTSVFARNTRGIQDLYAVPANVVGAQLTAVLDDVPPRAVKTGAFVTPDACGAVTARARAGALPNLVVDPVLTAAEGQRKGLAVAMERLLPYALVATPNREEASALLGWQVATPADMAGAASQLAAGGPRYVVVTGGDLVVGSEAVDAMWADGSVRMLHAPRLTAPNRYGSGAAFATAIAARLASGDDPPTAVTRAKEFVGRAIWGAARWRLGSGGGPIDHFGWSA